MWAISRSVRYNRKVHQPGPAGGLWHITPHPCLGPARRNHPHPEITSSWPYPESLCLPQSSVAGGARAAGLLSLDRLPCPSSPPSRVTVVFAALRLAAVGRGTPSHRWPCSPGPSPSLHSARPSAAADGLLWPRPVGRRALARGQRRDQQLLPSLLPDSGARTGPLQGHREGGGGRWWALAKPQGHWLNSLQG